jgi:hypothetical protein
MVPKVAVVVSKDWKSDFLSFVSERLEQIEKDYPMESMDDISKSLFANRSDIMGQAALALIKKNSATCLINNIANARIVFVESKPKVKRSSVKYRFSSGP